MTAAQPGSSGAGARKLASPPIVEAVVDLDCDMPPAHSLPRLESAARDAFRAKYPKVRAVLMHEAVITSQADTPPEVSAKRGIQAFQFLTDDERQVVQVRADGFSFNRLAPYTSLDDYLPEVENAWRAFVELASPIQVRRTALRCINRVLLPTVEGQVELNDFLRAGPRVPEEENLILTGFLDQHVAFERGTSNRVTITMATQPIEQSSFPIVLDIQTSRQQLTEPSDWSTILAAIQSLRSLRNRVFFDSLTERCMELFQ
jgi:uncharacterized protein (TIGR04255 family)